MVKNIIYVQQNEEVARSVVEGITDNGYEVYHCVTAGEAFQLMARQDAPLLMLDINIQDMRLREVVKKCSEEFPATVLAIFTDYPNSELLTKLINRHGIYKIFIAPWDMEEIVTQIEDAMEYAEIRFEQLQREGALTLESKEFDITLSNLKDSLKFQQHSYYKMNAVLNALLRVTTECMEGRRPAQERQQIYDFASTLLEGIIKSQTTSSLDINRFEELVREELMTLKHVKINGIESCLMGDIPRVMIANVKALIWCAVYYASRNAIGCEVEIISNYLTNTRIHLEINITYASGAPALLLSDEIEIVYDKIVQEMFAATTASEDIIRQADRMSIQMQVPISFLD